MNFKRLDRYGQELTPGDICARGRDSKVELVIYKGDAWGGSKSKGEFGRFLTTEGTRSVKYTSVVFMFDPMGRRRAEAPEIKRLTRKFYEEGI